VTIRDPKTEKEFEEQVHEEVEVKPYEAEAKEEVKEDESESIESEIMIEHIMTDSDHLTSEE
jgi:hypothetical protein